MFPFPFFLFLALSLALSVSETDHHDHAENGEKRRQGAMSSEHKDLRLARGCKRHAVPAEGAWSYEIQTPRVHALWSFKQPRGDELAGTLVLLPDRTLVRKAAARRRPKA